MQIDGEKLNIQKKQSTKAALLPRNMHMHNDDDVDELDNVVASLRSLHKIRRRKHAVCMLHASGRVPYCVSLNCSCSQQLKLTITFKQIGGVD